MSSFVVDDRGKFKTLPLLLAFVLFILIFGTWQYRYELFPELAEKYLGPKPVAAPVVVEAPVKPAPPVEPEPEPEPEITEVAVAAPVPPPVVEALPEPEPEPAKPAKLPATVTLQKDVVFPAIVNGKEVGKITAGNGTVVDVVAMEDGQLRLRHQLGGEVLVATEDTDYQP